MTSLCQRKRGYYNDSLSVDDTKWYPLITIALKDGTDIGNIDFSHVIGKFDKFSADTDSSVYRWQIRRNTIPDNPIWETPSTHVDTVDETAIKIDTNSTSITDGNGDLAGVFVDGGTLTAGAKNSVEIEEKTPSSDITNGAMVSIIIQATPSSSGTVSEIFAEWLES